jgi:ubiquitin-like 1-activating enzyme E1 A
MEITAEEAKQYDRQIRLWGINSQRKLRNANILLINISGLSCEILKNIVLSGINKITLVDNATVKQHHLNSNFLINGAQSLGTNIAESCVERLQILNPRVQIETKNAHSAALGSSYISQFDVVYLNNATLAEMIRIDEICRAATATRFWAGQTAGFYSFFFTDMNVHSYVEERNEIDPETQLLEKVAETRCTEFPSLVASMEKKWANASVKQFKRRVSPVVYAFICILKQEHQNSSIEYNPKLLETILSDANLPVNFVSKELMEEVVKCWHKDLAGVNAIAGGLLSQEIVKAISGMDLPVCNFFGFDGREGVGKVVEMM